MRAANHLRDVSLSPDRFIPPQSMRDLINFHELIGKIGAVYAGINGVAAVRPRQLNTVPKLEGVTNMYDRKLGVGYDRNMPQITIRYNSAVAGSIQEGQPLDARKAIASHFLLTHVLIGLVTVHPTIQGRLNAICDIEGMHPDTKARLEWSAASALALTRSADESEKKLITEAYASTAHSLTVDDYSIDGLEFANVARLNNTTVPEQFMTIPPQIVGLLKPFSPSMLEIALTPVSPTNRY